MGCGCGNPRSGSTTVYVLTMPNGATSEHLTREDAEYHNSRQGGGGAITELRP